MGSSRVTTWVIAARTLFCQVRAEKKPARCAASWTLSEKAMALGSSLWRDANVWPRATLNRLDARAPRMINASRAPQYGQSRLNSLRLRRVTTLSGQNTGTRRCEPQPAHAEVSRPACTNPQASQSAASMPRTPDGESSAGKKYLTSMSREKNRL